MDETIRLLISELTSRSPLINDGDSLSRGKLGVSVLSLLIGSAGNRPEKESAIREAAEWFSERLSASHRWVDCGLDGLIGFIWSLKTLENLGIISSIPQLPSLADGAIGRYSEYYREMPVQYNPFDAVYPAGLLAIMFCNDADSIESYYRRERTIHFIRDCEKILCERIDLIHSPESLTPGQLHSVLHFLHEAHTRRLFPFKTSQLKKLIEAWHRRWPLCADSYILDRLAGREDSLSGMVHICNENFKELARIGLFSFIYRKPQIFSQLLGNKIAEIISTPSSLAALADEELIGITFGILATKFYS